VWTEAGVVLSWAPVPSASGYVVLRRDLLGGQNTFTQPLRTTTYTDRSPTVSSYRYQVAAYYGVPGGNEGEGEFTAIRASAPVRGIADTHSHPFANLSAGGLIFWGQAYGPIDEALGWCDPIHGPGGVGDVIGNAARDAFGFLLLGGLNGHKVGGYKAGNPVQFDGWPTWNTLTHQQMYSDWIYRAYQGGLRLLVAHAVNNSTLCFAYVRTLSAANDLGRCDDMQAVDLQLGAAKGMEAYIDAQSGGPGKGWFRIAYTPEQARQIIYSGKLAVVLGIEVDQLFGCGVERCDDATVDQQLDRYYKVGVRHILPIHLANNAFGGYAHYDLKFVVNNVVVSGGPIVLQPCTDEGYEMDCNAEGLKPLGRHMVSAMMSRGMIIDVDHMSRRSANEALVQTSGSSLHYPVIAGHTGFLGVSAGHTGLIPASVESKRSEAQKTDAQLSAIRTGGGMVSVILHQGAAGEISSYRTSWNRTVLNDCPESSKTWAQAYLYSVDRMGGPSAATVGIGSDQMLNPMIAPRFHLAEGGCAQQARPVQYPLTPLMPGAAPMGQSVAGNRTFDFNLEGLAHYGLLPDFIQDLQNIGLTTQDLEPLFRSAEGYIQMWERAVEFAAVPAHTASAAGPSAP
jgi:microsomal dipeptidase-like Zn-dependent dipeptidase